MNTRTSIAQPDREPFVLESRKAAAPIVRLWLLRMLVPLGCHKEFIAYIAERFEETANLLTQILEMEHWIEQNENDIKSDLKELNKLHRAAEKELKNAKVTDHPFANEIKQVATREGFSDLDRRIFECMTLFHTERSLVYMVASFAPLNDLRNHQDVASVLSVLLALPQDKICLSFEKHSRLTNFLIDVFV